ncbi:hypothetical protein ALMP_73930 [Streptomyces sp. A012304]|nr:hypothetical protein ALMP_73930 [Streptomyces sp. A012304]
MGYVNGLKGEEARRWLRQEPNTPVRAGRLEELIDSVRGPVGGPFIPATSTARTPTRPEPEPPYRK